MTTAGRKCAREVAECPSGVQGRGDEKRRRTKRGRRQRWQLSEGSWLWSSLNDSCKGADGVGFGTSSDHDRVRHRVSGSQPSVRNLGGCIKYYINLRLRIISPGTLGAHQIQQHPGISQTVLAFQCTSDCWPESSVLRVLKLAASENRGRVVNGRARVKRVLTVP